MKKLSRDSTDIIKVETAPDVVVSERLFGDIRVLIESAKSHLAQTASTILATLYWNVGKRIKAEILGNERAQYGKEIVSALGRQLTAEYGAGFSEKSLWHMIRFAQIYTDEKIVSALRRELSWTHFKEIIYIDDPLRRRLRSMLSYCSLRPAGYGWLSTLPNFRRARFLKRNCMKRSAWRGNRSQPTRFQDWGKRNEFVNEK